MNPRVIFLIFYKIPGGILETILRAILRRIPRRIPGGVSGGTPGEMLFKNPGKFFANIPAKNPWENSPGNHPTVLQQNTWGVLVEIFTRNFFENIYNFLSEFL